MSHDFEQTLAKKTKERVVKCCNGYLRLNLLLLHDLRKQSNGILQPLCKNVVLGGTEHNVKLCTKYHATCDTSHVGRIGKLKLTYNEFPQTRLHSIFSKHGTL